jgi:Na+/H+ antiporter NhaA
VLSPRVAIREMDDARRRPEPSGELADPRNAMLPVIAALGGMLVPAAVYLLWLGGREVVAMQRLGFRNISSYAVVGVGVWLAFLASGVRPKAGVLVGSLILQFTLPRKAQ